MGRIISAACVFVVVFHCVASPVVAILGGYPQPPHVSKEKTTRFIVKFRDGITPSKPEIIQAFDEVGMAMSLQPLFTVKRVGPQYLGMEEPSETEPNHTFFSQIKEQLLPPVYANHCTNPGEVHNTGSCPPGYRRTGTCIKPGSPTNCTQINPGGGGPGNPTATSTPPPTSTPIPPTFAPGQMVAFGLGSFATFRQTTGAPCLPNTPLACGPSGALVCDGSIAPAVCKIPDCVGQQCTADALITSPFVSPLLQNMYAIITEDPLTIADFLAIISSVQGFEEAWPDLTLHAQTAPNDPYYSLQWGWKQLGLDNLSAPINQGTAVKVAVVDTGIDSGHEDLPPRSVINGRDYVLCETFGDGETCQNKRACQTLAQGYCNDEAVDDNGHGTHIAGIIAATKNNSTGVAAAPQPIQVIPVKVMNANGETLESWTYEGIIYAAHQGAKVINVSIGGCAGLANANGTCEHSQNQTSPGFRRVLNYAIKRGVTVVVAAGNENDDAQWYTPTNYNNTPGRAGNILVVSATGPNNQRASYANFGSLVDVSAPGGDVSTDTNSDGAVSTEDCTPQQCILSFAPLQQGRRFTDAKYESHAGTSMAAPFVAAEIAVLLIKNPNLSIEEVSDLVIKQSQPLVTDQPIGRFIDPVAAIGATKEASNINYVDPQCDLCGWCNPLKDPKPANWDSCHACLYDGSGNSTNKSYTVVGCVETTGGTMVQTILRVVLGISGGIAFLAVISGAYAVMTAAGDTHQLQMGKETIISALVGLFTILFSVFLLRLFGVTLFQLPGFS